jgi:hypothetical protein
MSTAYAVGYGYGARIGFSAKVLAHENPDVNRIWSDLEQCVRFPYLTASERDSLFKQMVCHVIYGVFPGAGVAWDFEAWRADPSWSTALNPFNKCQNWGNVPDAAAEFAGHIVQGSLDTSSQKTAWLVDNVNGLWMRRHILTAQAYFCLKASGAPGPDLLASDFLIDEISTLGPDISNNVCPSSGGGGPPAGGGASPSGARVTLSQGPAAPAGYRYAVALSGFAATSTVSITCYDSVSPGGFYTFALTTNGAGAASSASYCYSGDGPDHWVTAGGVESNHVAWGGGGGLPPPPPQTWSEQETPNHPVNSFTNYHNASGMGPAISAGQWVQVSCKVYDPTIQSVNPDGYWYRIASAPWNNAYYSPANTFMNGDPYGGPYTHNTDFAVPDC